MESECAVVYLAVPFHDIRTDNAAEGQCCKDRKSPACKLSIRKPLCQQLDGAVGLEL